MITAKKMDNGRDTKKGTSRFTKQSALGKSKSSKEKIKRLSFVRRDKRSVDENQMGSLGVSNGEDELSRTVSGKKHKMPRKSSDDRKAVNHSSIPRKLRSAMKKRTIQSAFPPLPRSKKLNHSYQKQQKSHQLLQQNLFETITKDEEEVVETLYLLAGMLSQNDTTNKSRIQENSSSAVDEAGECPTIVHEDSKEVVPSSAAQNACFSANEAGSSLQVMDNSSNQTDSRTCRETNYLTTTQYHEDPDDAATVDPPTILMGCVIEHSNNKLQSATSFGNIRHDASLKLPKENDDSSLHESKLEHVKALEAFAGKELKQHHGSRDCEHHGSLLWPNLSPATSKDGRRHSLSQSFAFETPSLPNATLRSIKLESVENGFPVAKVNKGAMDKMPWKRCAAHVYICHVIQTLKNLESNDGLEPEKIGRLENSKQGVYGQTNFRGLRNVWNGFSLNRSFNYDREGDSGEYRNRLQEKSQNQDQQLPFLADSDITSQRQSFDFFSLSTGSGGVKSSINGDELGAGNWLKGHAQLHVSPHLSSIKQQHTNMPQASPQSHYSFAYHDQLSPASKQLQPVLYPISSGYSMLHKGSSIPTKEHQYQQMQLAAELASRVKHVVNTDQVNQFPTVQNVRMETSNRIPYSQPLIPPCLTMHKARGDCQMHQHHQQLVPPPLVLSTVVRKPEHHKLSSYEENYSGFHSGSTRPLQLLCNERL